MRVRTAIAGLGIAAFQAPSALNAAETVAIGPPAAWVVPVSIPPAKNDEVPVSLLLQDQQFDLQPGLQSRYIESAFRINKPEGLAAGSVALAWNPELETVTFHKLLIRRGDTVIDVLAAGQKFTVVRRETNLEKAVLDGELTATLQPEGLQVGDIVDFAVTVDRRDPTLARHVELATSAVNAIPIGRLHLRAQWPQALPMRIRSSGDLAALKPIRRGALTSVELSMDDVQPVKAPKFAPPRYGYGRAVELTDQPGWSGIVDLIGPLYTKTATLSATSPLQAEIARIKAASTDPKLRAQAALLLVQDRVRYVFLAINNGGLVPADADTTWSRRFGDCKGKTVLLLALLRAMDIEAEPVLVSSAIGDGLDQRLPLVSLFDHVLVRATIAGHAYWLDGTRNGDRRLDAIAVPPFHWGLPLSTGSKALVPLVQAPLTEPDTDIALRLDATAGLTQPASAHAERILRGDVAVYTNQQITALSGPVRDQTLRDFWKGKYDFITPTSVNSVFDADRRELKLTMDGSAIMEWNNGYFETDGTSVGYKADFARDPGPDRDAPFAVGFPSYVRVRESVLLPPGAFTVYNPEDIDETVAGMAYRRHAEIKTNIFTIEETERSLAPEFPATAAPAAQETLRTLAKKLVYIQKPAIYRPTDADLKVTPTTAGGLVDRGIAFLDRGRFDEAIADFSATLALEPRNANALADRGLAHVWKQDNDAAKRDLDAALAIAPRNAVVFRGRGLMALQQGNAKAAILHLSTAIEIEPESNWAFEYRARAYYQDKQYDAALADTAALLKRKPTDIDAYLLRANIGRAKGDIPFALRQASDLVAANPTDPYALVAAARIQARFGDNKAAMANFDKAIAIKPEGYIYINRSEIRLKTDHAGRLADLDEAIKLDPGETSALLAKAALQRETGDTPGALATLTKAAALAPKDIAITIQRGIVYAKARQPATAARDFAAARALATTASALNALCWAKATANVDLNGALADCDAALAKQPGAAAILDSRAFVLLRLGRYDEAVAGYDKALAISNMLAASLYGRSIAYASQGKAEPAKQDLRAALAADPDIGTRFEEYGIAVPTSLAPIKPAPATGAS